MYEFQCDACGERFESLVDVGTENAPCRICEAPDASRVLSAQAAPFGLVQSFGQARKRERANAELHAKAKSDFKAKREKARKRNNPA